MIDKVFLQLEIVAVLTQVILNFDKVISEISILLAD